MYPLGPFFFLEMWARNIFLLSLILRVYSWQSVLIVSIKLIFSWWCITWLKSSLFRNCKLWNSLKTDQFTHMDFFHRKLNCWRCMHVEFFRRPGRLDSVHMIFLDNVGTAVWIIKFQFNFSSNLFFFLEKGEPCRNTLATLNDFGNTVWPMHALRRNYSFPVFYTICKAAYTL